MIVICYPIPEWVIALVFFACLLICPVMLTQALVRFFRDKGQRARTHSAEGNYQGIPVKFPWFYTLSFAAVILIPLILIMCAMSASTEIEKPKEGYQRYQGFYLKKEKTITTKCHYCGKAVLPDTKFCPSCGFIP